MFHLKVLLLRSSSFSVCLQVRNLLFGTLCVSPFCVKSISTLPTSDSLRLCYFLPHVVAVPYNWSLWCTWDRRMVRSTLVKFFTVTGETIQNPVSFQLFSVYLLTVRLIIIFRIVGTILGPTPLLAANFVIFGVLIHRLGVQYSRLTPKSCKKTYSS